MSSSVSKTRFAHTNLIADDWKKLAEFYIHVFDCTPVSSERDHHGPQIDDLTSIKGARVRGRHLRLPGHGESGPTLEIFQYNTKDARPTPSLNRPGFAHIAFEVDDVEKKREEIKNWGGQDIGKLVTLTIPGAGTLTLIYMSDPEGNIVELQKWE